MNGHSVTRLNGNEKFSNKNLSVQKIFDRKTDAISEASKIANLKSKIKVAERTGVEPA